MRIILDRNRYGDFFLGLAQTGEFVEHAETVFVPFVVLAELRAGFAYGRRQAESERVLRQFLSRDGISTLFADDQTTQQYATIYRQLRKQRTPIPANDIWLAALSLQHDLALHDRDKHFDHLPKLVRV